MQPVKAGFPSPAADYAEQSLDFNDLLVHRRASTFCLRVSGDSMEGAGILPGDLVVVDRSLQANHRDVVVAAVDGEFTLKRLMLEEEKVVLHPENPWYPDIELDRRNELEIFGVVTAVVRQLKP